MQLIPAIDIRNGQCVRLLRGDFDQETRYAVDPTALAREYHAMGAAWLHIVDLDGAATGQRANAALIREIGSASDLKVQLGGGIRTRDNLIEVLDVVDRAVIGSVAVTDPELVCAWLAEVGVERIALGLDVRVADDGEAYVTTHGWTKATKLTLDAAIETYSRTGLRHVLCTDVARDGALAGPNIELYRKYQTRWPAIQFQASGGVRHAADLMQLADTGVAGAISGKALLEKRVSIGEIGSFLPGA